MMAPSCCAASMKHCQRAPRSSARYAAPPSYHTHALPGICLQARCHTSRQQLHTLNHTLSLKQLLLPTVAMLILPLQAPVPRQVVSIGSRGDYAFERGVLNATSHCIVHTFDCTYDGASIWPERHIYHHVSRGCLDNWREAGPA